jgi:ribose transport system ATP-binding protein
MSSSPPLLEVQGLSRRFPGVLALDHMDFDVLAGEVHALVGENGAGKSTLINMLAGVIQPSGGTIKLGGQPVRFASPSNAQHAGLSVIFQEFNLLPQLSVAENIFINREPKRGPIIDWPTMYRRAAEVLEMLKIDIDPRVSVQSLSVAQQQLIEIARALSFKSKIIVMDEPTAALNDREVDRLLEIVRSLAGSGVGVIYVSHRLAEVLTVADRITVLRDGKHVLTAPRSELDEPKIVSAMVGRELLHIACPPRLPGELRLRVRDLAVEDYVKGVSFELRAGEVLGLAGLMGSGSTEVVEALFGLRSMQAAEVTLNGAALAIDGPRAAIRSSLGYVPEDRKRSGVLPDLSVKHNISLGILDRLRQVIWVNERADQKLAEQYQSRLNIRCSSVNQYISGLSGGNQQKVILARALAGQSQVLLLAEPTRGVDVGAKAEIYHLIDELVAGGMAVLVQTSELPELIRLTNRCLVFADGKPQGELAGADLNQENVMALATRFDVKERAA